MRVALSAQSFMRYCEVNDYRRTSTVRRERCTKESAACLGTRARCCRPIRVAANLVCVCCSHYVHVFSNFRVGPSSRAISLTNGTISTYMTAQLRGHFYMDAHILWPA